jgi:hypothetical protein
MLGASCRMHLLAIYRPHPSFTYITAVLFSRLVLSLLRSLNTTLFAYILSTRILLDYAQYQFQMGWDREVASRVSSGKCKRNSGTQGIMAWPSRNSAICFDPIAGSRAVVQEIQGQPSSFPGESAIPQEDLGTVPQDGLHVAKAIRPLKSLLARKGKPSTPPEHII